MHAHKQTGMKKLGIADTDHSSPEHDLAVQYVTQTDIAECLCRRFRRAGNIPVHSIAVIPELRLEGKSGGTTGFVDVGIVEAAYAITLEDRYAENRWVAIQAEPEGLDEVSWDSGGSWSPRRSPVPRSSPALLRNSGGVYRHGYKTDCYDAGANDSRRTLNISEMCWQRLEENYQHRTRIGAITRIIVEVKTAPGSIGEAMRQLLHYKSRDAHSEAFLQSRGRVVAPPAAHDAKTQTWDVMVLATTFMITNADVKMLADQGIEHAYLGERFRQWAETATARSQSATSFEI